MPTLIRNHVRPVLVSVAVLGAAALTAILLAGTVVLLFNALGLRRERSETRSRLS